MLVLSTFLSWNGFGRPHLGIRQNGSGILCRWGASHEWAGITLILSGRLSLFPSRGDTEKDTGLGYRNGYKKALPQLLSRQGFRCRGDMI